MLIQTKEPIYGIMRLSKETLMKHNDQDLVFEYWVAQIMTIEVLNLLEFSVHRLTGVFYFERTNTIT